MRDLDDALARLARRDQLQKRNSNGHEDPPRPAADEVADALRQIVERHPDLSAVVRLDEAGTSTEIRVAREAGTVRVTITEIAAPSALAASPLDPSPLDPSPLQSSRLEPSPLEPSPLHSSPLHSSPLHSSPFDASPFDSSPLESSPPEAAPVESAPLGSSPSLLGEFSLTDDPLPSRPLGDPLNPERPSAEPFAAADLREQRLAPPPAGPPEWPLRAEAAPGSPEARLAELVRRDPSLLERPVEG